MQFFRSSFRSSLRLSAEGRCFRRCPKTQGLISCGQLTCAALGGFIYNPQAVHSDPSNDQKLLNGFSDIKPDVCGKNVFGIVAQSEAGC